MKIPSNKIHDHIYMSYEDNLHSFQWGIYNLDKLWYVERPIGMFHLRWLTFRSRFDFVRKWQDDAVDSYTASKTANRKRNPRRGWEGGRSAGCRARSGCKMLRWSTRRSMGWCRQTSAQRTARTAQSRGRSGSAGLAPCPGSGGSCGPCTAQTWPCARPTGATACGPASTRGRTSGGTPSRSPPSARSR